MRMLLLPAFLFAVLAPTATGDDKTDADLKAMVGKWKIEKAELSGKDISDAIKEAKFEITAGGKYTLQIGEEKDAGSFTIDPSKKPKEIDVKPTAGPLKDKTMKAIYKLDGDTMTVCYQHDADGKRPEKFESKDGTTHLLIVYKRMK